MSPMTTTNGQFFLDSGPSASTAPALVLIHGAGGTHRHWPSALRALPGRRVIALDLPGHGASAGPAPETITELAQRLLRFLDELGLGTAVLAGHSMGGAIALTASLLAPERVPGLVLVGTGARLRVSPAVLEATKDPASLAQAAQTMAEWSFGPGSAPELHREFVEGLLACPAGVAHRDFVACNAFDVMARLGEVRAPTLLVCGAEDRLTPLKYSQHLRDQLPQARLEVVAGAGHMVMLEAPGAVVRVVEPFLALLG